MILKYFWYTFPKVSILRWFLTAWKVSKYGVFSGPYFPAFGKKLSQSLIIFIISFMRVLSKIKIWWPTYISASAKHVNLQLLDIDKKFTGTTILKSKARVRNFRK